MAVERDRLRVLLTTDTVGGVWQFAIELATRLVAGGDEVLLAAMGREPDVEQRRQAAAIPGLALHTRPYKLVWMGDPWDDLDSAGRWLRGLEARFAPDVVHLNDLAHGDLAWAAPVLVTAHSCVCSWWTSVHGVAAPSSWDRYRARVTATLHAADAVVAPTRAMLEALARQYGAVARAQVIHNGRDAGAQDATPKEPFVLGAGRLWDAAKNLGTLAAIAPRLPWPVHIAGQARCPDGEETCFRGVHALGHLPDAELRRWMDRAAIYALPARYEPFGLSALEAAQCGCALVLGDIASLREVWGSAALYVAPDAPGTLEATLRTLIDDGELRNNMARRARTRARRYTPEAMANRYRDTYVDLVARRGAMVEGIAPRPVHGAGARA
jgi:glycogen synthase